MHATQSEWLDYFKGMGLVLWMEGDALRYRAPKGVLNPVLMAQLKERKQEILQQLKAHAQAERLAGPDDGLGASASPPDGEDPAAGLAAGLPASPARIEAAIKTKLASVLFMETHEIDASRPLTEFGLDSVLGIELIKSINDQYGLALRATELYEYPTVAELAGYLARLLSSGEKGGGSMGQAYDVALSTLNGGPAAAVPQAMPSAIVPRQAATSTSTSPLPPLSPPQAAPYVAPQAAPRHQDAVEPNPSAVARAPVLLKKLRDDVPPAVASAGMAPLQAQASGYSIARMMDIDGLAIHPVNVPDPLPDEIQIDVRASAVNFGDMLCLNGLYPSMPAYPFVPGFEVAGVVRATGRHVSQFKVGDPVLAVTGAGLGGHATRVNVHQGLAVRKPEALSFAEAAALPVVFVTAYHSLCQVARVRAGETVLIQTAAGGVGSMAVQLAKAAGAIVIGTTASDEKVDFLRELGVDHVLDYRRPDFADAVKQITRGRGVDVVLNTLAEMIQTGLNLLAPGGRYVEIAVAALKASRGLSMAGLCDNQSFHSVDLRRYFIGLVSGRHKDLGYGDYLAILAEMASRQQIRAVISHQFAFEELPQALKVLEARGNIGKVVLNHQPLPKRRLQDPPEQTQAPGPAHTGNDPIAIVGMSGRFPGASDLDAFWANLSQGVDSVGLVPPQRWDVQKHFSPDGKTPNTTYCRWGGFMDGVDRFDANFFNISPLEARAMDPQQRLLLEASWHAFEHAGYDPQRLPTRRCGVFIGAVPGEYSHRFASTEQGADGYVLMGSSAAILSARMSYFMNLQGPNLCVDTSCSSSLVALELACRSLADGQCDMALAGGVSILTGPGLHVMAGRAGMLSPTGRCRTFAQEADGFVPGEAVGVVVLKRLSDALADGDLVHAVIKGIAVNQDGRSIGITAPNGRAQEELIAQVYRSAGINARTITYVETHGTGTKLGDPIEFQALANAFRHDTPDQGFCAIGSVKSNIGHALAAAGISGLLKVVLSLKHRELVPTLHSETVNEHLDVAASPFFLSRERRPWISSPGVPRRAALSSFGFSGTNCHVLIEEGPQRQEAVASSRPEQGSHLIALSAKTEQALQQKAHALRDWLAGLPVAQLPALADLSANLCDRRGHYRWRAAWVAGSTAEALAQVDAWLRDPQSGQVHAGPVLSDAPDREEARDREGIELVSALAHMGLDAAHAAERKAGLARLAQLYVSGLQLSWAAVHPAQAYGRLVLPLYPFLGDSHWQERIAHAEPQAPSAVLPADSAGEAHGVDGVSLLDSLFVPGWAPVLDVGAGQIADEGCQDILLIYPESEARLADALRAAHPGARIRDLPVTGKLPSEVDAAGRCRLYLLMGREDERRGGASPDSVRDVFRLLKAMLAAGWDERSLDFVLLTRGACVFEDGDLPQASLAAAQGMLLSVAKEQRAWRVVCVDAHMPQSSEACRRFAQDIARAQGRLNTRTVALWRNGRLYQQSLRKLALPPAQSSPYRSHGVYLIVGGMGGIGAALADHLAKHHSARLMLVGRSALNDDKRKVIDGIKRLGGEAIYARADLADERAMRDVIAQAEHAYGAIHGVFHSALALKDAALRNMSESDFDEVMSSKAQGCINLAAALQGKRLDFLSFFSSGQSFSANAGQSNYAAASRFEDAFALRLRKEGVPAMVVNWGYWGSVGIVANEFHRKRNMAMGALPIEVEEGFEVLKRCLAVRSSLSQCVAAKLDPELVKAAPEIEHAYRLRLLPEHDGTPDASLGFDPAWIRDDDALASTAVARGFAKSEDWGLRAIFVDLASRSRILQGEAPFEAQALERELAVVPAYHKLFSSLLDVYVSRGMLSRTAEQGLRVSPALSRELACGLAGTLPTERSSLAQEHPALKPFLDVLAACAPLYGAILDGTQLSTTALFPGGSTALVEAIYRGNAVADKVNARIAQVVGAACRKAGARPLRVLEIGAGTGGTSAAVLAALRQCGKPFSYAFTDVSEVFMALARQTFGPDYPELSTHLFDVDRDPCQQGFEAGAYDLVLAANVLHATQDIRRSVRHAKSLLRPGGLVVLNESVVNTVFANLTFGTLHGWWKFNDEIERLPASPLLSRTMWQDVLASEGFKQARVIESAQDAGFMPMAALLAESDGHVHVNLTPTLLRARTVAASGGAASAGTRQSAGAQGASTSRDAIRQRIFAVIAKVLQTDPAKLDSTIPYNEYGVDSINGLQIVDGINEDLQIELKPTDLFSYSTVDKLVDFLVAQGLVLHGEAVPDSVATPPPAPAASQAQAPAIIRARSREPDDMAPIAIIGMSGRFPQARNVDEFWRNLSQGRDCVGEVPASRWDLREFFDADPRAPRRTYSKWGGYLEGIDRFDPLFFNISPREAEHMDPQQRLFLQECWRAFEDAGYSPRTLDGVRSGVFVGCGQSDYTVGFADGRCPDVSESYAFLGNATAILSARISYFLNLTGPSMAIDTACSSSLVATHLACEALRRGECDLALAGGVRILVSPQFHIVGSKAGMLSPTGRCRAFDDEADGFVPGECAAALVLKRLDQAIADGDDIRAVIRGSRTNQDGKTNGITAPNALAQAALISEVHELSRVKTSSITHVESHGTGTRLGDPIEVEALTQAFRRATSERGFCALGSVKSHMGHALEGAGIASLAKLVLSLQHRKVPPSLHFNKPNRFIAFDQSPFHVNTRLMDWAPADDRGAPVLRGALSSFGFSGTNCHMVVDEWREGATYC